jgi:type 1 glutamine amidotransferase
MNPLARTRLLLALLGLFLALSASAADARKKLVMLVAEPEYDTAKTLPAFAAQFLEKDFRVVTVTGSTEKDQNSFDQINEVADADVLLISVRRRTPPKDQMDVIRAYIAKGNPVLGIRTASHAFVLRTGKPAEGLADWPNWDAEIFGGHYTNHHGHGPIATIKADLPNHPILKGVPVPFTSDAWFYQVSPLQPGATALLTGAIPDKPAEPVAYTFTRKDGGRSFYTSLGSPSDFQNASFQRLLRNALLWAASGK